MRKIKETLSCYRIVPQLLKLTQQLEPLTIPVYLSDILIQVLPTFLNLYLSAALINALLDGAFSLALTVVALTLLLNLAAALLGTLLTRKKRILSSRLSLELSMLLRKKMMDMSYESVERSDLLDQVQTAEETAGLYGNLASVVSSLSDMLRFLLTLVTSVAMCLSLCLSTPAQGNGWIRSVSLPGISLPLFFLCLAAMCCLSLASAREIDRRRRENTMHHAAAEQKIHYLYVHIILNAKVAKYVRLYHMSDMLYNNLAVESRKQHDFFQEMCRITGDSMKYNHLSGGFFSFFTYGLVVCKILSGAVTVGAFAQYTGAMAQFGSAFTGLTNTDTTLRTQFLYMKTLADFLERQDLHTAGTIPVEKRLDGEYELAFEDVSFRYPGSEEMILKHVTCQLNMKEKMAVVGPNGAGKTTFIKLLCRLYDPTEGRITLNGVDIRKYNEEEYRDLISVVFQDFYLFSFPLRENIAAGYEPDEEKLWRALRQAGAEDMVRRMPDGADTLLYKKHQADTKGVDISGGEAQKLALARALYKDAAVVILDEPTAALDPASEAQVYASFHEMVKDKTSIYISHRMSSCRFCSDILVFDQGRIAERGSHEQLLALEGLYASMWKAQARYYTEAAS